jgi:hypothetical protein
LAALVAGFGQTGRNLTSTAKVQLIHLDSGQFLDSVHFGQNLKSFAGFRLFCPDSDQTGWNVEISAEI